MTVIAFFVLLSGCSQVATISQIPTLSNFSRSEACWDAPQANTIEKIAILSKSNSNNPDNINKTSAILSISNGGPRVAYSAGLIVGWGKTTSRPDFSTVTAYGASALIAPFIFIGKSEDQKIGNIFHCKSNSLSDMAKLASSYIDETNIKQIADKHNVGGRLLVTVPASPARSETVWNLSLIAASNHPKTKEYLSQIIIAAVDPTIILEPKNIKVPAGEFTKRNWAFRHDRIGQEFLDPGNYLKTGHHYYLIHNDTVIPAGPTQSSSSDKIKLKTKSAYELFLKTQSVQARYYLSSIPERLSLPTNYSKHDTSYFRALFLNAYWQARRGIKWTSQLESN